VVQYPLIVSIRMMIDDTGIVLLHVITNVLMIANRNPAKLFFHIVSKSTFAGICSPVVGHISISVVLTDNNSFM